ncbi:hypothetical protein MMG00_03970 [Ignatzschineria rhizosphaerae]|uniref:Type 1 fimbrial protein n=1 Tax=Ignatzschineria rhizosphaerae TaxID=2923279 RepID=A0ABY3X2B5_9GAMM|nr:fimbrial protein [Ignatzschineria rhizosphaerae]UNM97017.1 hypothetical protein MMG00_03970 [Ignatzschineria rhizosphaerae]
MKKLILAISSLLLMPLLSYAQTHSSFDINGKIISPETICIVNANDILIPDTNLNQLSNIKDHGDWGYSSIALTECTIGIVGQEKKSSVNLRILSSTSSGHDYWVNNGSVSGPLGIELQIDEMLISASTPNNIPPKEITSGYAEFKTQARLVRIKEGAIAPGDGIRVPIDYMIDYK